MNKRLAKKVLSSRQRLWRYTLWKLGYGPDDGMWEIEKIAQRYINKLRSSPYKRTMCMVRVISRIDDNDINKRASVLVSEWESNRKYICNGIIGPKTGTSIYGDTLESGARVGIQKMMECDNVNDVITLAVGYLTYCSDRWSMHRVGVMDEIVKKAEILYRSQS